MHLNEQYCCPLLLDVMCRKSSCECKKVVTDILGKVEFFGWFANFKLKYTIQNLFQVWSQSTFIYMSKTRC